MHLKKILPLLLLPLSCQTPQDTLSIIVPPSIFPDPADGLTFTLSSRLIIESNNISKIANIAEDSLLDISAERDYLAEPLSISFDFSKDPDASVLLHLVLFQNTQDEINASFSEISGRDAIFFGSDATVLHAPNPNAIELLTPLAFVTIRLDAQRPHRQKFSMLPYDVDADGIRDLDLDLDTLPNLPNADCPFQDPDPSIQSIECKTLAAILENLNGADCDDADPLRNILEVDTCNDPLLPDAIDQDCSGAARVSCTPVDTDEDGSCVGTQPADLLDDPTLPTLCPNQFDDCDDTDPTRFPGNTLDFDDCEDGDISGGVEIDCDGALDFCFCDEDQDLVCTPTDCNDEDFDINPNQTELCDDIDNNCDGNVDEGCDDDLDGFCDSTILVVTNDACPNTIVVAGATGDDCDDDNNAINPGATEQCGDGINQDCLLGDNNGCDDDGDDFCDDALFVVDATIAGCPLSASNAQGNDCDDASNLFRPNALERCGSNQEEDCGSVAGDNNGCDDDLDSFCDSALFVVDATFAGCPLSASNVAGNDCNDTSSLIFPGAPERCGSVIEEDCGSVVGDNNGCDDDLDDFCDDALFVVNNATAGCINSPSNAVGNDCNDASNLFRPNAPERCGSVQEEDCGSVVGDNNGCDDDLDDFCDDALFVVDATFAGCVNSTSNAQGNDCDDADGLAFLGAPERCGDGADNNCINGDNEGCDDDDDDFCDNTRFVVDALLAGCLFSPDNSLGDDCNDNSSARNPASSEICGDGVDQDCAGGDNGTAASGDDCDDDDDNLCDAAFFVDDAQLAGCPNDNNLTQGSDTSDP